MLQMRLSTVYCAFGASSYCILRDINTTVSTSLEWVKKMSHPSGIPLAGRLVSETVAWIGHFLVDLAPAFALQFK